jgi:hypothetical protein
MEDVYGLEQVYFSGSVGKIIGRVNGTHCLVTPEKRSSIQFGVLPNHMLSRKLTVIDHTFTLHRFPPDSDIPGEILKSRFSFVCKTDEEISVLCPDFLKPGESRYEAGWACMKIIGPLGLNEVGVLAGVSNVLAAAGISLLAVSTFETDYFFVKKSRLAQAVSTLKTAGYRFV